MMSDNRIQQLTNVTMNSAVIHHIHPGTVINHTHPSHVTGTRLTQCSRKRVLKTLAHIHKSADIHSRGITYAVCKLPF